jgi:hypothetical protein
MLYESPVRFASADTVLSLVGVGKAYVKFSGAPIARLGRGARPPGCSAARGGADRSQSRADLRAATGRTPDSYKVNGRKPTDIAPGLPIDDSRVLNLLAE